MEGGSRNEYLDISDIWEVQQIWYPFSKYSLEYLGIFAAGIFKLQS